MQPRYIDGSIRLNALRKICPEFSTVCDILKFRTFREENPALSVACSIYVATYNADPNELIRELNAWNADIKNADAMPAACEHLARFFSESNEPTCTLSLLRWMQDKGYTKSKPETLRL